MTAAEALEAHLATGLTTVCRAWQIERKDGVSFAFTDHDLALSFDGIDFRPDAGLSAQALAQSTGLSVDNTEALGALSHETIREDEIEQGRFDGAEVRVWQVNWQQPSEHKMQFRGTIGQIVRIDGFFRAELRGLTEALNKPRGRIYQKSCSSVLGDGSCAFGENEAEFTLTLDVVAQERGRVFAWDDLAGFEPGFFTRGRFEVLTGDGAGLVGLIKHDRVVADKRVIELWEPIKGPVETETTVKLSAGCDGVHGSCSLHSDDLTDYRGFPDLPGEDWVVSVPKSYGANTGGSRR